MLRFIDRYFVHTDPRGSIEGLVNEGEWREMNLVMSDSEISRGNHYHKNTIELFIILEGTIQVRTQKIFNNKLMGEITINCVKSGDVFIIDPMTFHTFIPKTHSKWVNALSIKIDNKNPDIHRIHLSQSEMR